MVRILVALLAVIMPCATNILPSQPDSCGYEGTVLYPDDMMPVVAWALTTCPKQQFIKLQDDGVISLDRENQFVSIDLTNSSYSLIKICKILQGYLNIFDVEWFLPNNMNKQTSFRITSGATTHTFSLELDISGGDNVWLNMHSKSRLLYKRDNTIVQYISTNGVHGFLDTLYQYGVQNAQELDKVAAKALQKNLARSILDVAGAQNVLLKSVFSQLPSQSDEISTAIFDFIMTTSIVEAAYDESQSTYGDALISALFNQWATANKINLNDQNRPNVNQTPRLEEYMQFLLKQFVNGGIPDIWNLRDLFCNSSYWKACNVATTNSLSVFDAAFGALYEVPFGSEPQQDPALQSTANAVFSNILQTKQRALFEADVSAIFHSLTNTLLQFECTSNRLDNCFVPTATPQFNSSSLACDTISCKFNLINPTSGTNIMVQGEIGFQNVTLIDYTNQLLIKNGQSWQYISAMLDLTLATQQIVSGYSQHAVFATSSFPASTLSSLQRVTLEITQAIVLVALQNLAAVNGLQSKFDQYLFEINSLNPVQPSDYELSVSSNLNAVEGIQKDTQFIAQALCSITYSCDTNSSKTVDLSSLFGIGAAISTGAQIVFASLANQMDGVDASVITAEAVRRLELLEWFSTDVVSQIATKSTQAFIDGFQTGELDVAAGRFMTRLDSLDKVLETPIVSYSNLANFPTLGNRNCSGGEGNLSFTDFMPSKTLQLGVFGLQLTDSDEVLFKINGIPEVGNTTFNAESVYNCTTVENIVVGVDTYSAAYYAGITSDLSTLFVGIPSEAVAGTSASIQGNKRDNIFFLTEGPERELKNCVSSNWMAAGVLGQYVYSVYGGDGNDIFLIGSRPTFVQGGDGNDVYFITNYGANVTIDSSSQSDELDALLLNTTYDTVFCDRQGDHLIISYCSNVYVEVLDWFVYNDHHLTIVTSDYIQLGVFDQTQGDNKSQNLCAPVAVSLQQTSTDIDLNEPLWKHVSVVLIGDGKANGNMQGNYFYANGATSSLTGAGGADVYVLTKSITTINNFDDQRVQDVVILPSAFHDLVANNVNSSLQITDASNTFYATMSDWFVSETQRHAIFLSSDDVPFECLFNGSVVTMRPFAVDKSVSTDGINLDLQTDSDKQNVVVVYGSSFADNITGNALTNFIQCDGSDSMSGGAQSDIYLFGLTCLNATIDNTDLERAMDVALLPFNFSDLYLSANNSDLQLNSYENGTIVTLLNWFVSAQHQHLLVQTQDGLTSRLPVTTNDMLEWKYNMQPVEIDIMNQDCSLLGRPMQYDLTQKPYQNVYHFQASNSNCSYIVFGNYLNNYIDPGANNPYDLQFLKGGDGSDTYVIGPNYGISNQISNVAKDGKIDILQFDVPFSSVSANMIGQQHLLLFSNHAEDLVAVKILDYFSDAAAQHLLIKTADQILLQITSSFPFLKPLIADYSESIYSVNIDGAVQAAPVIYGSIANSNKIAGGNTAQRIVGGTRNDIVAAAALQTLMEGLSGNDTIVSGPGLDIIWAGDDTDTIVSGDGDDVIFGANGADNINGGNGTDTIVFSGHAALGLGVTVSLTTGTGHGADAEGDIYENIESIHGTEFDDSLEGDGNDNVLAGYAGNDLLIPGSGIDILYGGTGSDTYDLSDSTGWKGISNFATDAKSDLVIVNHMLSNQCNYSLNNDTYIHFGTHNESPLSSYESRSLNVLNVVLWNWLTSAEYKHLNIVDNTDTRVFDETTVSQSIDEILSDFAQSNQLTAVSATANTITVHVQPEIVAIAQVHRVDVAYVCDGSTFTVFPSAVNAQANVTLNNIAPGVMCTITLVLVVCNQIVAKSGSIYARTKPMAPGAPNADFGMSNDLTVTFEDVVNDYNAPLYQYLCLADSSTANYSITTTMLNTTECYFSDMAVQVKYQVAIESIAGDMYSDPSVPNTLTTGCSSSFCAQRGNAMYPITHCYPAFCMCSNGYPYTMPCYNGLYFNEAIGQCDFKANVASCKTVN